MSTAVIMVVGVSIALLGLGLWLMFRWIKKKRDKAVEQVHRRLGAERILLMDDMANFFGLQSEGLAQVRGNGCLAASADQVYFHMWFPPRQIEIPRERIRRVEVAKSHLKKSVGRDLLEISFENDAGEADSVAWYVRELDTWLDLLDQSAPSQQHEDRTVW